MNAKILQTNGEPNDAAMELAHEITHVENGDDETVLLPFSATVDVDYGIEHAANTGAIDKLLTFYLEDFSDGDSQINVMDFMNQCCIPLHFETYIRLAIKQTYSRPRHNGWQLI